MKYLKLVFGLALIPIGVLLGSFVPIGAGSGILIGFLVGIVLSYFFLTYGPGRKKSQLPGSYYLNHDQQLNGGINQRAMEDIASGAHEEDQSPLIYIQYPPPSTRR
ncbi:MAG TPA: hypothetical protein VKR83_12785 [Ktedonobacteraceae bacterium]|nr:hypothetical protein [Ktedonobacteraceae bacterium]